MQMTFLKPSNIDKKMQGCKNVKMRAKFLLDAVAYTLPRTYLYSTPKETHHLFTVVKKN